MNRVGMLGARCPSCGAEVRVAVFAPDALSCSFCGHRGPQDARVLAALQRAGQFLQQSDARGRQLSEAQRRALRNARSTERLFLWTAIFASVGVIGFAAFRTVSALMDGFSEDNYVPLVESLVLVAFAFGVAGTTVVARGAIRRRRLALEDAAAAAPPAAPGETCACYVCGAPLPRADDPILRCAHCLADNIATADVLARAAHGRELVLDDFETALRAQSRLADHAIDRATAIWCAAAVASWFVCGVPAACCGSWIAGMATTWNDVYVPTEVYVLVTVPEGRCIARVTQHKDGEVIDFGGPPLQDAADPVPFDVRSLAVSDAILRESGEPIRVVYVGFRDYGGYAQIREGGIHDGTRTVRPFELCLPPDSGDAT